LSGTPVLMYHGIVAAGATGADKYGISEEAFRRQLGGMTKHKLRVGTLSELRGAKLDSPSIVITFDDGLTSDHAVAFPALVERKLTAHFFCKHGQRGQAWLHELGAASRNGPRRDADRVTRTPACRPFTAKRTNLAEGIARVARDAAGRIGSRN